MTAPMISGPKTESRPPAPASGSFSEPCTLYVHLTDGRVLVVPAATSLVLDAHELVVEDTDGGRVGFSRRLLYFVTRYDGACTTLF